MATTTGLGKRGRPSGQSEAIRSRNYVIFLMVDWIMVNYGRPLGDGRANRGETPSTGASASVIAAWMLSGGHSHAEDLSADERWEMGWGWHGYYNSSFQSHVRLLNVPKSVHWNLSPSQIRKIWKEVRSNTVWKYLDAPNETKLSRLLLSDLDRQELQAVRTEQRNARRQIRRARSR